MESHGQCCGGTFAWRIASIRPSMPTSSWNCSTSSAATKQSASEPACCSTPHLRKTSRPLVINFPSIFAACSQKERGRWGTRCGRNCRPLPRERHRFAEARRVGFARRDLAMNTAVAGSQMPASEFATNRTHVLALIPSRPLSNWTWPICHEIDQARCLHRDLSWTTNIDQGSGPTRETRHQVPVRTQQSMGDRRLSAVEHRALHQSFLPAERRACGAQGPNCIGGTAFHRTGGGDYLQLRTRLFRLFHQENRLPVQIVPRQA